MPAAATCGETRRLFFFQAEDGIRDFHVTGVQTCALPILRGAKQSQKDVLGTIDDANLRIYIVWAPKNGGRQQDVGRVTQIVTDPRAAQYWDEIGRASCREGVYDWEVAVAGRKRADDGTGW